MRGTDDDVNAFRACFAANGSEKSSEIVRWQYLLPPTPGVYVDFAVDPAAPSASATGIYAVVPLACTVGDSDGWAAHSLDTLTDHRRRGRGVFTGLAESLYRRLASDGCTFVYGFPNASSAPGFFGKLGWVSLDPVPLMFRPLRTRNILSRLPRVGSTLGRLPDVRFLVPRAPSIPYDAEVRDLETFDRQSDEIWRRFSSSIGVALQRDHRYLAWRLQQKPEVRYTIRGYYQSGRLLGFVATSLRQRHGGSVGYLMELLYLPGLADVGRTLLQFAIRDFARQGADTVVAWNLEHSPNHAVLRSAGFRYVPSFARPSELHFGVRAFEETAARIIEDRRNWYISYCDSDTD